MFTPWFDVDWFHTEIMFTLVFIIMAAWFTATLLGSLWQFVEDDGEWFETFAYVGIFGTFILGLVTLVVLVVGAPLLSYGWFPLSVMGGLILLALLARGVRRLQKDLKEHVSSKTTHAEEK